MFVLQLYAPHTFEQTRYVDYKNMNIMQRTTNPPVVQANIHPTRLQFPDDFQAIFLNFNNCYWITAIRYLEHKLHINHSCPLVLLLLFSLINDVTYNILMVAGIKLARRLIDRSFTIQACPANCGICKITALIYIRCDSTLNYIATIMYRNDELSSTMIWVGCLLTDSELPDTWKLRK